MDNRDGEDWKQSFVFKMPNGKSGTFTEDEKVLGTTSAATANVVSFANTNATGTTGVLRVLNIRGEYSQGVADIERSHNLDPKLKNQEWKRAVAQHIPPD